MASVTQILLIIGAAGTFVFMAASCGGNVWVHNSFYNTDTGLWKVCDSKGGKCVSVDDIMKAALGSVPDYWNATRAFSIMGCLAAIGGLLMAILGLISEKVKGIFASVFLFGAGGCMLIAMAVFTGKSDTSSKYTSYGWSYFLGWVGMVGGFVSGIIGIKA